MIELKSDQLVFSFPEIHPQATLAIEFQRTLRIPDDDKTYPLPPGLGRFPLRHVDDFSQNVPEDWVQHGGVMLPMYQSEALWLNFSPSYVIDRDTSYPFAIKVATGKIDAVTGKEWTNELRRRPQNYMVAPKQPWLDGYNVGKDLIRQFVAMPLGAGYTAEEQITQHAEHGGLQILVHPMKREVFERRFPKVEHVEKYLRQCSLNAPMAAAAKPAMGLAPGGRMRQTIYKDTFDLGDWDTSERGRCFVHIANSMVWESITGSRPPTVPPTAKQYSIAGLPWFDYYDDGGTAVETSSVLGKLKSVLTKGKEKGDVPLAENESSHPDKIVKLRVGLKKGQVREGQF